MEDPFLLQHNHAAELFIVRHGDAIPGADEIIPSGIYDDLPLSRIGREQAVALAERLRLVVLIDLDSSNGNGHEYLASVIKTMQPACVLVLTSRRDPELYQRIAQQGCMGVVLKDEPIEVLLKAIERVSAGEIWFDGSTMAGVLRDIKHTNGSKLDGEAAARIATLTKREREVVILMSEGLKTGQLAERMFISETTVRHHLTSVFDKLDVADRFELVFYAYKHGLAPPPPR